MTFLVRAYSLIGLSEGHRVARETWWKPNPPKDTHLELERFAGLANCPWGKTFS